MSLTLLLSLPRPVIRPRTVRQKIQRKEYGQTIGDDEIY